MRTNGAAAYWRRSTRRLPLDGSRRRWVPKMAAAAALSLAGAVTTPSPELPVAAAGPGRAPEEELPVLEPAEVRSRLERSARQFRNRRKVLIRGLPADVSNQVPAPGRGEERDRERAEGGPGES